MLQRVTRQTIIAAATLGLLFAVLTPSLSAENAHSQAQQAMYEVRRANLDAALARWKALREQDIAAFKSKMQQAGIGYLSVNPASDAGGG